METGASVAQGGDELGFLRFREGERGGGRWALEADGIAEIESAREMVMWNCSRSHPWRLLGVRLRTVLDAKYFLVAVF